MAASARNQVIRSLFLLSKSGCSSIGAAAPSGFHRAGISATAATADVAGGGLAQTFATRWAWQSSLRHQSTSASAQQLLDGVSATQLREALTDEAEIRPFMSNKEFVDFILAQKAASTESEAQERADVLAKAGVVLRFNGLVYLKPQEVSEIVYKLLPGDDATAERSLAEVEQELTQMDKQHKQIYNHAQRWARRWLVAGCAVLATQLVAFTYLTWWELSWDVMEPVAYILSLSYSLLAYIYFLYTRGSYFEQKDFKEYWEHQLLEKRMAAAGFDLDKYHHLMRTRERYKRYMSARIGGHHQQQQQPGSKHADTLHGDTSSSSSSKLKES